MAAKAKPEPRRVRLTVPAADESTQRWLDLQDDQSVSMRLLIRESIERDGYIDVMNKPVEQLPRRGRPPGSSSSAADVRGQTSAGEGDYPHEGPRSSADVDAALERGEFDDEGGLILDASPVKRPESEPDESDDAAVEHGETPAPEATTTPKSAEAPAKQPQRGVPSGLSDFLTS